MKKNKKLLFCHIGSILSNSLKSLNFTIFFRQDDESLSKCIIFCQADWNPCILRNTLILLKNHPRGPPVRDAGKALDLPARSRFGEGRVETF
jgi:hypothetical protein